MIDLGVELTCSAWLPHGLPIDRSEIVLCLTLTLYMFAVQVMPSITPNLGAVNTAL